MPESPEIQRDGVAAWHQKREPTKLESALLGALSATIVLGILFWIGIQFSLLKLIIQIS